MHFGGGCDTGTAIYSKKNKGLNNQNLVAVAPQPAATSEAVYVTIAANEILSTNNEYGFFHSTHDMIFPEGTSRKEICSHKRFFKLIFDAESSVATSILRADAKA